MKCKGNFVFKQLTHRNGGTFKNSDGTDINYPSAYILKADEVMDNGDINEHKFKIDEKNTILIERLKGYESYQKIIIEFNVTLFTSRISLEVADIYED